MNFIKLTPELLAAVGAKTEDEFHACLISKLSLIGKPDAALTATVATQGTEIAALKTAVAAIPAPVTEARITEIAVAAVPADIKALAKSEGSRAAVGALANTGSAQPAAANPAGNDQGGKPGTFAEVVKGLVASGKTRTQATTEAIKSNPKEYAEYLKVGGSLN